MGTKENRFISETKLLLAQQSDSSNESNPNDQPWSWTSTMGGGGISFPKALFNIELNIPKWIYYCEHL